MAAARRQLPRQSVCTATRDSPTPECGYRVRLAYDGYRIIDAEGKEVWRIVVLRMRDWPRGLCRALRARHSVG